MKMTRREAMQAAAVTSVMFTASGEVIAKRDQGKIGVIVDVYITDDGLYQTRRIGTDLHEELIIEIQDC